MPSPWAGVLQEDCFAGLSGQRRELETREMPGAVQGRARLPATLGSLGWKVSHEVNCGTGGARSIAQQLMFDESVFFRVCHWLS